MLLNSTLNLLPDSKKTRLERLVRYIFVRDILEIIVLIYTVLAIALLWGYRVLQEEFNGLAESAASVNMEHSTRNQEVKKINELLRTIKSASADYFPIAPKINELAAGLPADIKISAFNFDKAKNVLTIAGTAQTRAALINYQKILRELPWIEKVNAPTSQLFQKDNINFEIKAGLKNIVPLRSNEAPKQKPTEIE